MTAMQIALNLALAETLESGKYEQGKNRLRDGDKFCCIGVACDLIDPKGWKFVTEFGTKVYKFDGQSFTTPSSIRDLYGWSSHSPTLPGFESRDDHRAAALNDRGVPFSEIAVGFRRLAAQGGEK